MSAADRWNPGHASPVAPPNDIDTHGTRQFQEYARPGLDKHRLGELIDTIGLRDAVICSKDIILTSATR